MISVPLLGAVQRPSITSAPLRTGIPSGIMAKTAREVARLEDTGLLSSRVGLAAESAGRIDAISIDASFVYMSRTIIDIDDDALAAAAKVLSTSTKKDTVNAALREVAGREVRARMLDRFADDPAYWQEQQEARERAWRRDDR